MEEILKNILGKLESVFQSQQSIQKEITEINSNINSLETSQQRIRQSQVRMEDELTEKIRALFDDRELNRDYFESLKDSQARIEENIENIFKILKYLDSRQSSQEQELRLLRAVKNK